MTFSSQSASLNYMHRFKVHASHLYAKFERNVLFILLFLFFVSGYLTSEYLANNTQSKKSLDNNQCKVSSQCAIPESDMAIYLKKGQELQNVSASLVSFSSKVSSLTPSQFEVAIMLQGTSGMKVDATDLSLIYSDNVSITSIQTGNSFASYQTNKEIPGKLRISGVTKIENNIVKFGEVNTLFATITFEKNGDLKKMGTLTIDPTNTKVFYQGVSVLDIATSINQIKL